MAKHFKFLNVTCEVLKPLQVHLLQCLFPNVRLKQLQVMETHCAFVSSPNGSKLLFYAISGNCKTCREGFHMSRTDCAAFMLNINYHTDFVHTSTVLEET